MKTSVSVLSAKLARKLCATLIFVLSASVSSADDQDQYVIVESTSDRYLPLLRVDSAENISLNEGEFLILVDATDRALRISGPIAGALAELSMRNDAGFFDRAMRVMQTLFDSESETTRVPGAVRGGEEGESERPSLWALNAQISNTHCIPTDAENLTLFHPNGAGEWIIESATSDKRQRFEWRDANPMILPMPEFLNDDALFVLRPIESTVSVAVALKRVPATASSETTLAFWLAVEGCEAQRRYALREDATL